MKQTQYYKIFKNKRKHSERRFNRQKQKPLRHNDFGVRWMPFGAEPKMLQIACRNLKILRARWTKMRFKS